MTYADELLKEDVLSNYLAVIIPRRLLAQGGWIISGSNVYQSFTLGEIVNFELSGTELTKASSVADVGTGGDWYFDIDAMRIYCDSSLNPNSNTSIVFYEIHLSTFDAYWYRDPLDATTRTVYYEPLISKSPDIISSSSDDLSGFLPTYSSTISIINATSFLTEHVYASSFNLAEIRIYHYLDELTIANTKLVLDAFTSNVTYKDDVITIEIKDNISIFDNEFRHLSGKSFFGSSFLSGLDPDFEGKPIRKVFGRVDAILPVNIDFNFTAPSITNNRTYVVMNPHDNLVSIETAVSSSPASTTTRTYLVNIDGLTIGDAVWFDQSTDEYVVITNLVRLSGSTGYIEHAAIVSTATSATTVKRGFIGNVYVYRENFLPLALAYNRDYTIYTDATNKLAGFTLADNFESNYNGLGEMFEAAVANPQFIDANDLIYCRVYGNSSTASDTLSGIAGSAKFSFSNSLEILYSMIKNYAGVADSKIDKDALDDLFASGRASVQLGFAIPDNRNMNFPSYRQILIEIAQSVLLKFFINDSSQYSFAATGLLSATPAKTIEDDEIIADSFEYTFDYKDIISDVLINYNRRELSSKFSQEIIYDTVSADQNQTATLLHKTFKQKTFNTLLSEQIEAQTLADRISTILGERKGRISLTTKNRFFDTVLNETYRATRDRMPGYAFVDGTDRSTDATVLSARKSINQVQIELDDQKGIEDNSSEW